MIELSHVTKTFGGATRALDDLTLTVPQSAVYGLVGSNGAGKTTAIRHITGIFRQDSGSVTIGGLPVYENPAVKSRIGYIPDDLGVFGGGTLRELAAFYRTMYPRFDAKRYAALRDVVPAGRSDAAAPVLQGDAEARGLLADAEPAAGLSRARRAGRRA
ncbi:MAG: ATP-binding cassette domain-containing protein [Oscillospiraceae bacterium]